MIQQLLEENRLLPIMDLDDALRFRDEVDNFLGAYSRAAHQADVENLKLFTVATKHHWMHHWGERAIWINPSKVSTIIDERFAGTEKEVAATCFYNTP